jgi:hypothetical protein
MVWKQELFFTFFASVFGTQSESNVFIPEVNDTVVENDLLEFSDTEIVDVINGMKRNKSYGIDGVIAEVFMDAADIVAPFLTSLFNHIFVSGSYLKTWGDGIIVPIHNKVMSRT